MESGIRLDISGGINTVSSPDQIPENGGGMPFLQNVRRNRKSMTVARFPLGANLLTSALAHGIYSVARLNDPYNGAGYAYVTASNSSLYVGNTQVASGLSGQPVSFLAYRPAATPKPFQYVADPSLSVNILNPSYSSYGAVCGMLKTDSLGNCYKTGIAEPQSAPVVSVGAGTGPNWATYRYVYRAAPVGGSSATPVATGATSNPSPESAPQILPQSSDSDSQNAASGSTVNPNVTYNSTQYQGNSNQIRTAGGVAPGTLTDYIIIQNFGLSVPSGVNIDGIQISINWVGQYAGTGILANAALYYGGVILGQPKSPGIQNAQTSTTATQGGGSDLWGAIITSDITNDPTFGFGIQILAQESGGSDRSFINSFTITVYYTTLNNTGTCASSLDPQVNTIDVYRQTPALDNFTYVLSVPNSSPSFTDNLSDLTIANNPILNFNNYEPFPSIDLPRSGICNVTAVSEQVSNIAILSPGSGQTDGTYTIPGSGGGGTGASVQIVISGGLITTASVIAGGSGYTSVPTFTVSEGGTPGVLAASISPIIPLGANVSSVSGDPFNVRWLPGTVILIQNPGTNTSTAYTLYNRPTSSSALTAYTTVTTDTGFISFGFPPAGTNLTWQIAEPDLAAQPSPVIWGPTPDSGGGVFMMGLDPLNPGDLLTSMGNNFDSAPQSQRLGVCSPSEGLVNGIVTSELHVVFSPERFWLLYPNFSDAVATVTGITGPLWTPVQAASTRGLFMTHALGALGTLIAWRAKDGIFVSKGGGPEEDISENIYNLFPHGEPESPSPVTIGNQTIYPPDDTKPNAQTIACVPGYIFYDYQDTTGTPRTLVFDMEAKGWIVDSYTPQVNFHALPTGVNQILCGCTDGTIRAFDSSGTETGTAIIITRSENKGSTRIVKRIGGVFLRAVAASAITLAFWANRIQTAITGFSPSTAGTGSSEMDYLTDFTSATNADVKDLACEFSWSLGSGNILSEWQPDWAFLPAAVIGWKTGLLSYGLEGWGHLEWINLSYQSTAEVTLVMTPAGDQSDSLPTVTLTFPSTNGVQAKQFTTFPANKFKVVGWTANSSEPFTIFAADSTAMLSGWGTKSGPIKVFQEGWGNATT